MAELAQILERTISQSTHIFIGLNGRWMIHFLDPTDQQMALNLLNEASQSNFVCLIIVRIN